MLVLGRKLGEEILIGGSIRVKVVAVDHNSIRLGIEAPPHVPVDRAEIRQRKLDLGDVPRPFAEVSGGQLIKKRRRKMPIYARSYAY